MVGALDGGLPMQVRVRLCSSQAHPFPASPPGSPELSVSHPSSPVPSKQPGGGYYSFLYGIDKDTGAWKGGKVSTQDHSKASGGAESQPQWPDPGVPTNILPKS